MTFLMRREQVFPWPFLFLCNLQNVIESSCNSGSGDKLAVSNTDRFGLWYSWTSPEGGELAIYTALQVHFLCFYDAVAGESQK